MYVDNGNRINGNDVRNNVSSKLQAFCKRKYMSEFCKEMSRSANVYLKDFQS